MVMRWSLYRQKRQAMVAVRQGPQYRQDHKACQDLPGQELLEYVDDAGSCQDVTSSDVNDYLKEITGKDITAKDFRTWAGTVLAAMAPR
jgi:DNA topoisomerase IB